MIEVYKSELDNNALVSLSEEQYMAEGFNPKDCWFNLVNPSDK